VRVVLRNGKAVILDPSQKSSNSSALFAKPVQFHIMTLDPSGSGSLKWKGFNRSSLSEMLEVYEDVKKIRREDSHFMIMVANKKLVKHTGQWGSPEMNALIGLAIKQKYL
jgi:hypothetical protein